jgi:hypothetical protein
VTSYCLDRFFARYLEGTPGPSLADSSPLYPEIQVLGE